METGVDQLRGELTGLDARVSMLECQVAEIDDDMPEMGITANGGDDDRSYSMDIVSASWNPVANTITVVISGGYWIHRYLPIPYEPVALVIPIDPGDDTYYIYANYGLEYNFQYSTEYPEHSADNMMWCLGIVSVAGGGFTLVRHSSGDIHTW